MNSFPRITGENDIFSKDGKSKKVKKTVDGFSNPAHIVLMPPNQHDPTKRVFATYITRERYYQVKKLAKLHGMSMAALISLLIERAVRDVMLDPEDYERIANEIREAKGEKSRNG